MQTQQFMVSGRIVSAFLVVVVLFLATQMIWSDRYAVRVIDVVGAKVLTEERVNQMVGVRGMSIWAVDPDEVAATIKASPYVDAVSVGVRLPDTVTVSITEHQSDIRWKVGEWYLMVDALGTVMGTDTEVVLTDTLVINDDSGASNNNITQVDPSVIRIVQALALRLPVETNLEVTRYGWDPQRGVTLNTVEGRLILLGDETRLEEKLQLLRELSERQVEYVFFDLRSLTPYYRNDIPPQALLATTTVVTDTLSVPESQP